MISQPQNQHGGVVQYDFGKTGEGGRSKRTGFLNSPPPLLLSALAKLRADHYRNPANVTRHLSVFDNLPSFSREQAGLDVLFKAVYEHTGGADCSRCSTEDVVQRAARGSQEPEMHYGTIASGNQVMKDGVTRDRLCAELGGVLCFEMEAAGLMNNFPCLVIRGICDYSDSHKNKTWQPYASATAAACAKEILHIVPTAGMTGSHMGHDPDTGLNVERRKRYLDSLKFDEIEARRENIKKQHLKTCQWLLSKSEYQDWRNSDKMSQHHGLLWIRGKPGTGKSTIMKFAHAAAKRKWRDNIVLSFFFNARGESMEKSVEGMYRTLLLQLLENAPDLQIVFDVLGSKAPRDDEITTWDIEVLKDLFRCAVENLGERTVSCFIDALDECEEDQVRDMVIFFEDLGETAISSQIRLYTCFSSRHYPHITVAHSVQLVLERQEDHTQDIESYLHYELKAGHSKALQDIKAEMLERARGIFLWVVLVVRILNKEYDRGRMHALRNRLNEIPDGLDDLFNDILTRDCENLDELILCVQWILFAKRPLKREELYFAMLAGLEPDTVTSWKPEEITTEDMDRFLLSSSKGLAEVTRSKGQTVQFIHESVRDFLLKGNGLSRLQSNLQENFPGVSHDRLKTCCQLYTQIDFSDNLPLDRELPNAPTTEAAELRQLSSQKFPFLEYAIHNMFEHADAADAHGVSQTDFVKTFALKHWIVHDNLLERYQVRRHTVGASMLYIFAERNLPNLIRIELERVEHMDIPGERYGYPIIVALAGGKSGNRDAVRALLTPGRFESDVFSNHTIICTTQEREAAITHLLESRNTMVASKELTRASQTVIEFILPQPIKNGLLRVLLATKKTSPNSQQLMAQAMAEKKLALIDDLLLAGVECHSWCETSQIMDTLLKALEEDGHERIVEHLIAKDVSQGTKRVYDYHKALCVAIEFGRIRIAELLIREGAEFQAVDLKAGLSTSPLFKASKRGDHETVALLLREGADVDAQGSYYSALHAAARYGHHRVVILLLDAGAVVDALQWDGHDKQSALRVASGCGHEEVVRVLLRGGARVNLQNGKGDKSALYESSIHGHLSIVELLLNHGADVEGESTSALLAASRSGHEDILKLLLGRGADVQRTYVIFGSALTVASREGRYRIVSMLLRAGADVDISGMFFNSPLLEATLHGHERVVMLLLNAGADPNVPHGLYGSVLGEALEKRHMHIAELLVKAGARLNLNDHRALAKVVWRDGRAYVDGIVVSIDYRTT